MTIFVGHYPPGRLHKAHLGDDERKTEMGFLVDFFRCKRCDTAFWAALFGVIGVCRGRLQGWSRQ
jgi:hypothetical protein